MSTPGAFLLSRSDSGTITDAMIASGAPITKRRLLVAASKGAAEAITRSTRARMSATGSPSSSARAVGTTPFGSARTAGH